MKYMNHNIQTLQKAISPHREQIVNHKVYSVIENIDDLKVFMSYHVFAVWDFMSLLKCLQNQLTCTSLPWFPIGEADIRYLINEIVLGEESDIDANGKRKSHFEMYVDAMHQIGASTQTINNFIVELKNKKTIEAAAVNTGVPHEAQQFMNFTFNIINSNKNYLQSAVFTFGREDLIPGMFMSLIKDLNQRFPQNISGLNYYLERHIEVDGDHHSNLAMEMTSLLCGNDEKKWQEATTASIDALKHRILLWNGIYHEIVNSKKQLEQSL
jgi:hypothetical protein